MSASTSQFLSKFHSLFNNKKACTKKLVFISSIWDDDCINRLDENNWQCLWRSKTFQGINATNYLAQVLGKRGMHIKSCY